MRQWREMMVKVVADTDAVACVSTDVDVDVVGAFQQVKNWKILSAVQRKATCVARDDWQQLWWV
jgi:hypothetical protein